MTTVSARRSTRGRRRIQRALRAAAGAAVAAATITVGAQFIGATPPAADSSPYCAGAYQCIEPGADSLLPNGPDALIPLAPAIWNSGKSSVPIVNTHTGVI
jgi:hypothetical protein